MPEYLIVILIVLSLANLIIILLLSRKQNQNDQIKLFEPLITGVYEKITANINEQFFKNREETRNNERMNREEMTRSINEFNDQILKRMSEISQLQKNQLDIFAGQLDKLTRMNEEKFNRVEERITNNLKEIRDNNDKKLEEMRITVDEKLHDTLEKRLGESFKIVSERLEIVHKGLGEMQSLATGVGDLKRVLTNVKTRGTWGEIQLENLIEQILTPDQFARNVEVVKNSGGRVDFAVKLPGRSDNSEDSVWLPIDAKFPLEDYQRLLDAQDNIDPQLIDLASKEIEKRVKENAKSISSKYIAPPATTDFAVMFLPIEGLYAEILRRAGLAEQIQREYRVILAGPTNIAALLNSLQMGFKSLAIEKRSSEVWKLLGAVKTEFGKFADMLEKTQSKLDQASKQIGEATTKTRTIERRLRTVQEIPASETDLLLED